MKKGDKVMVIDIDPESARWSILQFYPPIGWEDKISWKNRWGDILLENWFIGFQKESSPREEIIFLEMELKKIK
jgi:hypothetical protein